jgi:hypothetical protein
MTHMVQHVLFDLWLPAHSRQRAWYMAFLRMVKLRLDMLWSAQQGLEQLKPVENYSGT